MGWSVCGGGRGLGGVGVWRVGGGGVSGGHGGKFGKPKIICEKKWQKNEPNI